MVKHIGVYCLNCGEYVRFARPPVEVKTRIGARKCLVGTCDECGGRVSRFLPSENGPTVHSVRVGEVTLRELQRASSLIEVSQRAIIECLVAEHLDPFVTDELWKLEAAGVISRRERAQRERELAKSIEHWTPPEREQAEDVHRPRGLHGLIRALFGEQE